jgi:catechol 2,3-dioxygenase-like lactoylglutathione lyase family enzyme
MTEVLTHGIHHVGLTVPDLEAARSFFCATLNWHVVGGDPDYPAVFGSDGRITLTLWRVADPQKATAFDRRSNIGLHHLALTVSDDEAVVSAYERVRNRPGVVIEFAPAPMRPGFSMRHFICAIPGGVRVEFATPFA